MSKLPSISFHAHHSPVGAHSSFTVGLHNRTGGFALEGRKAADQNILAGFMDNDDMTLFPFFQNDGPSEADAYDHQGRNDRKTRRLNVLGEEEMTRTYGPATDKFQAGNLEMEIISPFFPMDHPDRNDYKDNKYYCCPVIFIRLSLDNTKGASGKTGMFVIEESLPAAYEKDGTVESFDFLDGRAVMSSTGDAYAVQCMGKEEIQEKDFSPHIQSIACSFGYMFSVPAGEKKEIVISAAFYRKGTVTRSIEMPYWYTRFFARGKEAALFGLDNYSRYRADAEERDRELAEANLNEYQKFLVAHAIHSYYGSTQWFSENGKPFWNVNEGEYRMLNTFDLTVDMLFYEMRYSPWTVRNVLENYAEKYSYRDEVFAPGNPEKLYPGGISFTHDMGACNNFSQPGYSGYERSGLDRACFSYMTHEQLVNWILTGAVYLIGSEDKEFRAKYLTTFKECYNSMLNRDNPEREKRNGLMSFESSRCLLTDQDGNLREGGEITTYDSLDHSLGQSRANIYLAVKSWAAYLALEKVFRKAGEDTLAREAYKSAELIAETIIGGYDESRGFIPAVLEGENDSAIIPAIEGLAFPKVLGQEEYLSETGPFSRLITTLRKHFTNILTPEMCLYDDMGWKLSSSADNSWMSKICLCQYVARSVLDIDFGDRQIEFDKAHARWEIFGSAADGCSDQFRSGVAKGSLYYPRIVTSILWLDE